MSKFSVFLKTRNLIFSKLGYSSIHRISCHHSIKYHYNAKIADVDNVDFTESPLYTNKNVKVDKILMQSAVIKRPNLINEAKTTDDLSNMPSMSGNLSNVSKMEALVLSTKRRDVCLCQVSVPNVIKKNEVCIKVEYAAATATDLGIIDGKIGVGADGVIMGRELSGVVCGTGDVVHHVKAGDNVVVAPCQPLSVCRYCYGQNNKFCIKENYDSFFGINRHGGWANFATVPGNMVYKVDNLPLDKASLLPQLAQAMCALSKVNIQSQWKVLIQGAGLSGLFFALLLKHSGHENVKILEDNPNRLKIINKIGIDYPIIKDCNGTNIDIVLTSGGGADVMQQAYSALNANGQIIVFGQTGKNGDTPRLRLTTADLSRRRVAIIGLSGTPANPGNVSNKLANELLDLAKLGVDVHPLKDHAHALSNMATGDANSVVFWLNK